MAVDCLETIVAARSTAIYAYHQIVHNNQAQQSLPAQRDVTSLCCWSRRGVFAPACAWPLTAWRQLLPHDRPLSTHTTRSSTITRWSSPSSREGWYSSTTSRRYRRVQLSSSVPTE